MAYDPDSLDRYATQRPSGENTGTASSSDVRRNGSGLPGLGRSGSVASSGSVQRSKPVSGLTSIYASRRPSGEKDHGTRLFGLSRSRTRSPAPSLRTHQRLNPPAEDRYAMC